ncbi:MAG: alpha/beta hydrolase [Candidatus Udaeobacter sp.]
MKRFLIWSACVLVILIAVAILAFTLSPWPSVALITYAFAKGARASEAALEKHVPSGIVARRDVAYGSGKNETFDLYYQQEGNAPRPTIVWVHGGGFVAGNKNGITNYMKILAGHGYTMIAVEYSRGYGTTYPQPVEEVNAALGFVVRNAANLKVDPAKIVLAGDSAGAHIASQVAMITTDPDYARAIGLTRQLKVNQLLAMLLFSGVYDPSAVNPVGNHGWFLKAMLWAYSGVKNFRADDRFKLMSVTGNVTRTFPPTFISSGNADPLAPQAVALAEKLMRLGVRVDSLFFPSNHVPPLPHEYQFNLDAPTGQEALQRMLAFLSAVGA